MDELIFDMDMNEFMEELEQAANVEYEGYRMSNKDQDIDVSNE